MTNDGMPSPIRALCFWTVSAVFDFGSLIATIALQVLVMLTVDGSAAEVRLLNAARWLRYLLFGLVVGARRSSPSSASASASANLGC